MARAAGHRRLRGGPLDEDASRQAGSVSARALRSDLLGFMLGSLVLAAALILGLLH